MDTSDLEAVRALVASIRAHLEWRRRFGVHAVPAAAAPRTGRESAGTPGAAGGSVENASPRGAASGASTEACAPSGNGARRALGASAASVSREDGAPRDAGFREGRKAPEAVAALAALAAEAAGCARCKLAATRNSVVFGRGDPAAELMFVGEGPGADEDRLGEPFVGAAGKLLDKMIAAMGLGRDEVYICNIVKCRPPGNRDPEPDEVSACEPFLLRQIELVRPRIIVTLGKPAAHCLLRSAAPIGALRGRWHEFQGIPLRPTYHPAALLRNASYKRPAWDDLKAVMAEMDRLGLRRRHE